MFEKVQTGQFSLLLGLKLYEQNNCWSLAYCCCDTEKNEAKWDSSLNCTA